MKTLLFGLCVLAVACDAAPEMGTIVTPAALGTIYQADDDCPDADPVVVKSRVNASIKRAFATVQGTWPSCRIDHDDGASPRTVTVSCLDVGIVEGVITDTTFSGVVRLGACYVKDEVKPHVVAFTATIE